MELLHGGPAITGSAGNDDRMGSDLLIVGQSQNEVAGSVCLRAQCAHFVRDCHLGTEFLRLIVGARHQGNAGDPSWKAEIIFNPGRCASLTAKGAAIEHQHGESF